MSLCQYRSSVRGELFSWRSCRSSSVSLFWAGDGNFLGNLAGISGIFFRTHKIKAQKYRGKLRCIVRGKFVPRKSFVPTSFCRPATLRNSSNFENDGRPVLVCLDQAPVTLPRFNAPSAVPSACPGLGVGPGTFNHMSAAALFPKERGVEETGGILFREYCFGRENSLSSAANSVSSARNSVSSRLHTNNRLKRTR